MLTDNYKGQVAWRDAAPELESTGPRQRHGNKAESGAAASRIMEVRFAGITPPQNEVASSKTMNPSRDFPWAHGLADLGSG